MCRERVYIEPQLILRGLLFEPLVIRHIHPLNAAPEYTRGHKMSPCRGPRVYSGAESVFGYFYL